MYVREREILLHFPALGQIAGGGAPHQPKSRLIYSKPELLICIWCHCSVSEYVCIYVMMNRHSADI